MPNGEEDCIWGQYNNIQRWEPPQWGESHLYLFYGRGLQMLTVAADVGCSPNQPVRINLLNQPVKINPSKSPG